MTGKIHILFQSESDYDYDSTRILLVSDDIEQCNSLMNDMIKKDKFYEKQRDICYKCSHRVSEEMYSDETYEEDETYLPLFMHSKDCFTKNKNFNREECDMIHYCDNAIVYYDWDTYTRYVVKSFDVGVPCREFI